MESARHDLRLALRKLMSRPLHSGLMIATLALGVMALDARSVAITRRGPRALL
jgi:hypothetical protein